MSGVVNWLFGSSTSKSDELLQQQQNNQNAVAAGQQRLLAGGGAGAFAYTDRNDGASGGTAAARGLNKLLGGTS
jgi:hypothetical protein